jgi:hypothetical protein
MTAHSPESARQLDAVSTFQVFAEEAAKKGNRIDLATFVIDHANGTGKRSNSLLGPRFSELDVKSALVEFADNRKVLLGKLSELEEQAEKDPGYEHPESHCTVKGRKWLAASGNFFFGIELVVDDFRKEENARTYYVCGMPKPLIERIKNRLFSTLGKQK